jgi:hypothetical protein
MYAGRVMSDKSGKPPKGMVVFLTMNAEGLVFF